MRTALFISGTMSQDRVWNHVTGGVLTCLARASEYSSKIAVYSICIGYALGTLSLTFCGYIHRTGSLVTLAEAIIFRMAAATSMAAAVAASIPAPQAAPTPSAPTYEAIPASMAKVIDIEAEIPITSVQLDAMVSRSILAEMLLRPSSLHSCT